MKAVIFDMDGTMVNNMEAHHRAWQRHLANLGLHWDFETVKKEVHGINEEIMERIFGDRFSQEERRQLSAAKEAEYRRVFKPELKLVDGLPRLLDELSAAGIPMGVGTAAPVENVDFVLDELGLRSYFQVIMHAGHVAVGKPNPEIFQKAAQAMGVAPEDCLVFEDSPVGAATARNFGSRAIIVTTSHQPAEFAQFDNVVGFVSDFTGLNIDSIRKMAGFL